MKSLKYLLTRTLTVLILTLSLTSCAMLDWLSPPSAQEQIDPNLLRPVEVPLAKGFTPQELLQWGIQSSKELHKVDCRLYEVRRINTLLADKDFTETRPIYCERISVPVE